MMDLSLPDCKIAILVSNGFTEQDVTESQRAFRSAGADLRIISADQGLISGWNGEAWGHSFAVDSHIGTALGADYTALIIPGGERSLRKLKQTAHTRRFIGSFMASAKPVIAVNDAIDLLVFSERICNRKITGSETVREEAVKAGAVWESDAVCIDNNLMTLMCDDENRADIFRQAVAFMALQCSAGEEEQAQAA